MVYIAVICNASLAWFRPIDYVMFEILTSVRFRRVGGL